MLGHQFVVKNSRVWHPNTQMSEWSGFDKITNAKGMYLYDSRGRKYIDGVASMWCNVWGHSKSELVSAIKTQSSKLQHSPMFNLTNEPTELLAKLLVNQSPGMSHVFFSDNGSTSMEIAAKFCGMQYWSNIGECCSFDDCVFMAETNSDFECPHTLHHMDATPSMYFLPRES